MTVRIVCGDCRDALKALGDGSVNCVVTSPPYWGLRDYATARWEGGDSSCDHGVQRWEGDKQTQGAQSGHAAKGDRLARRECECGARRVDHQLGLEATVDAYVDDLVAIFEEVWRVLRDDGTAWLNLGDSYISAPTHSVGTMSTLTSSGRYQSHAPRPHQSFRRDREAVGGDRHRRGSGVLKPKDLVMVPARVALALQAQGWWLRQDIIWAKPNPMPESVGDRCTKSHEHIFLLTKNGDNPIIWKHRTKVWTTIEPAPDYVWRDRKTGMELLHEPTADADAWRRVNLWEAFDYYYDAEAISEDVAPATVSRMAQDIEGQAGSDRVPGKTNGTMKAVLKRSGNSERKTPAERGCPVDGGNVGGSVPWEGSTRNKRDVWTVTTKPFKDAHFATFPPDLIEPCILAGCPVGGTVLDPFGGAGTTGLVADRLHRNAVLIELNPTYVVMARRRIEGDAPLFAEVT